MTAETFELIMQDDLPETTSIYDAVDQNEAKLHTLCLQIAGMQEQIQQRIWSLLKIPIAPATLCAALVAVLDQQKIVPQGFANFFYGVDALFTTLHALAVVLARTEGLDEITRKRAEISDILNAADEEHVLKYQALLDAHGVYPHECSASSHALSTIGCIDA